MWESGNLIAKITGGFSVSVWACLQVAVWKECMLGMMTRGPSADVVVVGWWGEMGRK